MKILHSFENTGAIYGNVSFKVAGGILPMMKRTHVSWCMVYEIVMSAYGAEVRNCAIKPIPRSIVYFRWISAQELHSGSRFTIYALIKVV